jgi:hypothetical protein
LHYEKSTSNHHSVKLRRLGINLIFNQPKHHSSRCVGANCSFTCLHKTMVLPALYLASTTSLIIVWVWSLLDYKGNYKHKAELKYVSECRNHEVWSRSLKCSVKSYVIGPSTKWCSHIQINGCDIQSAMVFRFCVRPTLKRWVFKNNPSDHETWSIWCHVGIHADFTSILHSNTLVVPQA